jgi:hypothetical protein
MLPLSAARLVADQAVAIQHFEQHVLPIFQAHCYQCHAGGEAKGGMRLDTRARLMRGGESGSVVDLDRPAESLLLAAIRYEGPEMPPRGPLNEAQLAAVGAWLDAGAPYPPSMLGSDESDQLEQAAESLATAAVHGRQITDLDRRFWAFQPIASPSPAVADDSAARGPIDAWIDARLKADGIEANGSAEPAHLLRRLHYDLIGLPPTLDDIREFEADPSETRYRQWVDRLLASPRYGERWGRHWLDLVRYAETNSYERDGDKPEVWRYRDFVVDSFNRDKPYDQFAREQLAGDEIGAGSQGLIATGYYRLGIWDDEPVDAEQALYDDLDDIVSTTGQVFLGLTLGCARCHDHKIDPLTQVDYYRFLAFFNGLNRYGDRSNESVRAFSLRSIDSTQPSAANQQYQQHRASLVESMRQIESLVIGDLEPVEHEEFRHEVHRLPILSKRVGRLLTEQQLEDYRRWREELVELDRNKPSAFAEALCVTEVGAAARPTHVLARGNPASPGEEVVPGGPEVLGGWTPELAAVEGATTSGRRKVLADWIASPENPLFARVIANRLWQYHFGQGLVRTPSDFGYQGARPSHPELLDYLAGELISDGWQIKPLHRQMVLSNAYRRSSEPVQESLAKDPGNETYWRFGPRRLSAEEVHDTIWAVAGDLNLQMCGPSMFPELEPEVLAGQSRPGDGWQHSPLNQQARRAIYAKVKRSLRVPLLANYDAAEPDFSCPARFNTTTPAQALGMINSQFVHRAARRLAERVVADVGDRPEARVRAILERTLRRSIQDAEVQRGVAFVRQLQGEQSLSAEQALEMFALVALNLNELVYLD